MKNVYRYRWVYVVNGFVALLCIGCSYAWSVFVVPLEQELHWVRSETSLAFTLNIIFYSLGSLSAGLMAKKLSYSNMMRIAAIFVGVGFCLTSFVITPWQVYITYSLLCGCGIGIGYNCIVSVVPRWFPGQTGLISGILLVGYAMSTAIFGPAISKIISSVGIAWCFRILSGICLLILMVASFLICSPKKEQLETFPNPERAINLRKQREFSPKEMVRTTAFWVNLVVSAMLSGCGLTMINHISPLMTEEIGVTAAAAAMVLSLNSVCNGLGRIVSGIVYDRKGCGVVMLSIPVLEGFGAILLALGLQFGSALLCTCGSGMLIFGFGSAANMIPTMARELFGEKFFSINFPIVNISSIIAACIPTLIGTLQITTGGYKLPMYLLVGVNVLCFLLALILTRLAKQIHEEKKGNKCL